MAKNAFICRCVEVSGYSLRGSKCRCANSHRPRRIISEVTLIELKRLIDARAGNDLYWNEITFNLDECHARIRVLAAW
jgi:hypothetical protein